MKTYLTTFSFATIALAGTAFAAPHDGSSRTSGSTQNNPAKSSSIKRDEVVRR